MSSDLPGVNLATLNGMILYYHLMTKWSGLGDNTVLSQMGLLHLACKVFLDHPQNFRVCWRGSRPSPVRVSNKQNIYNNKKI
jgi:hypothetical protein